VYHPDLKIALRLTRSYLDSSRKLPCALAAPRKALFLCSMANIWHRKAGFAFIINSFHLNNIFLPYVRVLGGLVRLPSFQPFPKKSPGRPPHAA